MSIQMTVTETMLNDTFPKDVPISMRTFRKRSGLNRREARYFINQNIKLGKIKRVNPSDVGCGKCSNTVNTANLPKAEKDKYKKNRSKSFNRAHKTGQFNVFVLV